MNIESKSAENVKGGALTITAILMEAQLSYVENKDSNPYCVQLDIKV